MTNRAGVLAPPLGFAPIVDPWAKLAAFLIVGYLGLGKPFAYIGLPWISVYIGEMALAMFLFFGPELRQGAWLALTRRITPLRNFNRLLLLSLLYGGFASLHGILVGYPVLTALRDTAFNYYPIFLLLGIWVGLRDASFLIRVTRMLALWAGCYGFAYVVFLNRIPWTMPGTDGRVPVFLGPYGASTVALLGLLSFEPKLGRVWHLLLLNFFVLLGVQVRAEWTGLAAGVLVFAWLTRKLKRLALIAGAMAALFALMYATHLDLDTPTGRGDTVGSRISADFLLARAIAPVSEDLAGRLADQSHVTFAAGTTEWRLVWWANIWAEVHSRLSNSLVGFGYGYPIGDLNPEIEPGMFIQTPHNDLLYALAFSGWPGVALFALLQLEIGRLLWRSFKLTASPFGLVCWAAFLTMSLFEDLFEAPFAAIPCFLLLGAALAPALLAPATARRQSAPPGRMPQASQAAN